MGFLTTLKISSPTHISSIYTPTRNSNSLREIYFVTTKQMGLQSQLSDMSSESTLIFMVVLIGKSVRYLHSVFFTILRLLSPRFDSNHSDFDHPLYEVDQFGLADLVVMLEQLNLNRVFSYTNKSGDGASSDCVVCLNRLGEGDRVRKLACLHVFHKECFDGWLHHLNFNCPLCRSPVVPCERVNFTRRRVSRDVLAWFTLQ
ncbi:E3 ubiquitin- ligase RHA2A-like [Olea europaea subsp. europaea]|uniref:E3 ubiquitin- ligase RHA2A-like n=2 Tax=Olea europaea subsp. europaea TaxID=158383 RepID=A0A8S0USV9_OLEEU|nr:E3 ubiquitin- ligase RHA2A-like [Olea europaea subsp. europaea]